METLVGSAAFITMVCLSVFLIVASIDILRRW